MIKRIYIRESIELSDIEKAIIELAFEHSKDGGGTSWGSRSRTKEGKKLGNSLIKKGLIDENHFKFAGMIYLTSKGKELANSLFLKESKIQESTLKFEIQPMSRVEAMREANQQKKDGKSTVVAFNSTDETYSVFNEEHFDFLQSSKEVDMTSWKEIKKFVADNVESNGTEIVTTDAEETPEDESLDVELNEPTGSGEANAKPMRSSTPELDEDENDIVADIEGKLDDKDETLEIDYMDDTDDEEPIQEESRKIYRREYSLRDSSVEAELLYNANATDKDGNLKILLKQYSEIENLYNNVTNLKLPIEKVKQIRFEYDRLLNELEKYNLKDIDKDGIIMRMKKYLGSNLKNNKVLFFLKELGLLDDSYAITPLGKWVGVELQNTDITAINIMDESCLEDWRDTLQSLYSNGEALTNSNLRHEYQNVLLHNHDDNIYINKIPLAHRKDFSKSFLDKLNK